MSINNIRRALYKTQRTLGDAEALKRGTLPKRLIRRHVTRRVMRPWDRLWR